MLGMFSKMISRNTQHTLVKSKKMLEADEQNFKIRKSHVVGSGVNYKGLIWFSTTILNPLRPSATKGPVSCLDNCRKPNLPCTRLQPCAEVLLVLDIELFDGRMMTS